MCFFCIVKYCIDGVQRRVRAVLWWQRRWARSRPWQQPEMARRYMSCLFLSLPVLAVNSMQSQGKFLTNNIVSIRSNIA